MSRRISLLSVAVMLAWVVAFTVLAQTASASSRVQRAPSLPQATYSPDFLTMVQSDDGIRPTTDRKGHPRVCRHHYFTEVQAYAWNGNPIPGAIPQRWDAKRSLIYWIDGQGGGRVTFDGLTFHNHTSWPVLVAGWCS